MIKFDKSKTPEEQWDYIKVKCFKDGKVPKEIEDRIQGRFRESADKAEKWATLAGVLIVMRKVATGDEEEYQKLFDELKKSMG